MDREQAMRLQAFLDEELDPAERIKVEDWLSRDGNARQVFQELEAMSRLLREHEPQYGVPVPTGLYWSTIERALAREAPSGYDNGKPAVWTRLIRLLAPVGVVAGIVGLMILVVNRPAASSTAAALAAAHEIDTPLSETSSMTFRSESDALTVVWVASAWD